MDWVAADVPGPGTVLFSLMSQYTPWGRSAEFPEIHRRLRAGEMRAAAEYMRKSGAGGLYPGADQRPAGIYTPL